MPSEATVAATTACVGVVTTVASDAQAAEPSVPAMIR